MFFGFNFVDLLVLIFLASYTAFSYKRGFLSNSFELLGFILALFWAIVFYPYLSFLLQKLYFPENLANTLSFLAIWIITDVFVIFVYRDIYKEIPMSLHLSKLNRYWGALPAFISGLAIVAFVATFLVVLPINNTVRATITQSQSLGKITALTSSLSKPLESAFAKSVRDSLVLLTSQKEGSSKYIVLNFPNLKLSEDSSGADQLFVLVNQERRTRGLKEVKEDETLKKIAKSHALDMFQKGYFGHYDPEGHDPLYWVKKTPLQYKSLAENISYAPDISTAHEGLMKSTEHRAAILSTKFSRVGIAVIDSGNYGKISVQFFAD
ncbi:MAG TPA: CvpA family protein [Candidatus Saccharimonadales bacterium]|nr:CvpA family protein [Candidatus Saccharimonadales bacterium]